MGDGRKTSLNFDKARLHPGMRIAVAVSGGADSVALLRTLAEAAPELGLVVSLAHVHHGIRGADADADAAFVQSLAERLGLKFFRRDVDTPAAALANRETIEEAARNLRYGWFRELLAAGEVEAVGTAHTFDDQAETVLQKLMRGAWTEGLSGIHPVLACPRGVILRPFLRVRRVEIEAWLKSIDQPWREDSSNRDEIYTRNRIRHSLLPALAEYNPQIQTQLAHLATIARDEEAYWKTELERILPSLLLPGKAVRGGGRAQSTHPGEASVGMEIERLRPLHSALRRRVLRAAARSLGSGLNFEQTERLLALCGLDGHVSPKRESLTAELRAERTPRELRLVRISNEKTVSPEYALAIPGEVAAESFGLRLYASATASGNWPAAVLRASRAGDRVTLRHSSGPKRLKEVLERMQVPSADRGGWPVVEWQGEIVWVQGVEVVSPAATSAELTIISKSLP